MVKSIKEYSYEELLDRALSRLPKKEVKPGHFEVPKAEVINVGNKTIIRNFKYITEYLNREPKLLTKYFVKELAVPGTIDEAGALVLQGKFSAMIINKLIERFVKLYVICPTCGSHYTELIREGKVFKLKCLACGAETTLKAF
ncbi:translation initiation factor IF-2 subunit beta [Desulfurococcaceae archaeon MEX13E-LK6-19]|nr:translation initiation factor IF-2 subunit beta [Desulfurococcaceae archaeon MEX13E-LK6-19]